ncbi:MULTISPECIES: UvrD-helicase domain-containing protein [Pontibacillus]|uniref:AAA family ATPase n=1 Tax=Pontibacillus chungwhensis TaxID=265426 RepID=A0ABY8V0B5_9BACI|nr:MULTISPECIES: UvrD-helicase domain-containing protein [Pontibacillus]MCD5324328.1 AAA family ATPase [Pontibacillus sp. HN14]WIF99375.1 AAA family ATPase [Pontibacillus chungwhensis]
MNIVVAGAGAGKTTSMAEVVISRLQEVTDGKIIYVITYTNSARDRIRNKIIENEGKIPNQLKIETIHTFLLREVIYPFNHLIYDNYYKSASQIPLSSKPAFKAKKKKELKEECIIHVEDVTKTAKYILCGKSKDTKIIKFRRDKALQMMFRYLDSIYVDESQDIDSEFLDALTMLHDNNIKINLIGDPKQDLRNRGAFRNIIESIPSVQYKSENYRCPRIHVDFSNSYIVRKELQNTTKKGGSLQYILESNTNIKKDIESGVYDLAYIYQKNARFKTHREDQTKVSNQLFYELKSLVRKVSSDKVRNIDQVAYVLLKKTTLTIRRKRNTKIIFAGLEHDLGLVMQNEDKGKIGNAVDAYRSTLSNEPGVLVNSIDSIKGLEGNNCLFIVSTQLAPYLFKDDVNHNKMMNYLYVGLTRSKRDLTIMVTNEVENKYGLKYIHDKFKELGIAELRPPNN